jgi:hypothetical protein
MPTSMGIIFLEAPTTTLCLVRCLATRILWILLKLTHSHLFLCLNLAFKFKNFNSLRQCMWEMNDSRKTKQPILKTRTTTNSSSKSQRSIGTQCYCKKLQISSGYTQILIWKIWTCSAKSGPFWNSNPPSLLHDITAEKMEFVFGFETLTTPQVRVYVKSLKGHWGNPSSNWLWAARSDEWPIYSYIKPCCFATAMQQGTHYLSIKVPLRSGGPFCFSRSS